MDDQMKISVIGLGYVGMPLAVALSKHFSVVGFDIHKGRIEELRQGVDRTQEVLEEDIRSSSVHLTSTAQDMRGSHVYIVAVPTPITETLEPDLSPLEKACIIVGGQLARGEIVVFESTVFPGVTEEYCAAWLEEASGLKSGKDFYLGYSPERINPGDKIHRLETITKVVAGQTPEVTECLRKIYGVVNGGKIFVAANIRTAEMAKVIENAQRDINVAFINEVACIAKAVNISVYDVLEAAETKWNFLPFKPGLVGGHCIGVDPYYLAQCAENKGIEPKIVLSGRELNEEMSQFFANIVQEKVLAGGKIAVLGLTFKENVPDLRNSQVAKMISFLKEYYDVQVYDPMANIEEALQVYNLTMDVCLPERAEFDALVLTVGHDSYVKMSADRIQRLLKPGGAIIDFKGVWRCHDFQDCVYNTL